VSGNGNGADDGPRCADCAYMVELDHPPGPIVVGTPHPMRCQRYPKQMTIASVIDPATGAQGIIAGAAFPPVLADEWCGEFLLVGEGEADTAA